MLSNRILYLSPPPRGVPLRVACSATLGMVGGMGVFFFLFGMLFVWGFAGDVNLLDEWRLARSAATSQAVVTHVTDTNSSENDETVYRYTFSFETSEEKTVTAHSYSTGHLYAEGNAVNVSYLPDKPDVARLEGTRLSTFSAWVLPFVLIFPLIGLAMLGASTVSGLRQVFLLSFGEISVAQVLSSQPTGMRVNKQPVIEYCYELRTRDGQRYVGKSRALLSERVGDEAEEPVLYLPSNPKLSVLVDALPLRYPLEVDTSGQWTSQDQPWPVVWFGLAWMGITALVVYSLLRMLS